MAHIPWLFRTRSLVSKKKSYSCRQYCIWDNFGLFFFCTVNGIRYVVCIHNDSVTYSHGKENRKEIPIMPPDLA